MERQRELAPAGSKVEAAPAAAQRPSISARTPVDLIVASAVQRKAGNAAIARVVAAGSPLPTSARAARETLGPYADQVRVHTGPAADVRLTSRPNALAVTDGAAIHVGSRAPSLDSPAGQLLLAHEAAHVRQQLAPGPAVGRGQAEEQADRASVAASLGRPVPALSHAPGPLYFEARWHQASLTGAMASAGLSDAEQREAYFGNWARDLSQALVPVVTEHVGAQAAFQLVNLMAMRHFGHGITPAQLGSYDPKEHIDNPAGTTDRDVIGGGVTLVGHPGDDPLLHGTPRGRAGGPDASHLTPQRIAASFAVDEAGIPAYILRSRTYIRTEVEAAIAAGRTREGLLHVGNFSHTTEDLFAHSNWIEIAIGRLISEGQVNIDPATDAGQEVSQRLAAGRPPIEDFAAQVGVHARDARPILSTGTFTGGTAGHDTVISMKAEAQNLLRDRQPFKEDDAAAADMTDFLMEVLRNVDRAASEGTLGDILVEVVEGATSGLSPVVGAAVDGLPAAARRRAGAGVLGDLAVGAAELLGRGATAVSDVAGEAWRSGLRRTVRLVANRLGPAISLVEIALYLKRGVGVLSQAWKSLKEGIKALPDGIEALVLPRLVQAERAFKQRLRALANAAYGRAVELLVDGLEGVSPVTDAARTNVGIKLGDWEKEFVELKTEMCRVLRSVGGRAAEELAVEVAAMEPPAAIGFAQSQQFQAVLRGLAADVARDVLTAARSMDDKANSVSQLSNVPDWARAGASHSQIAKDHDDGAFFGVAFAVARAADTTLLTLLTRTWAEMGQMRPVPDLAGGFAVDSHGTPTGHGLNDAEQARRAAFLETRAAGDHVVREGHAENQDMGPRLADLAQSAEAICAAHPALRPTLAGLIALLRTGADGRALEAELVRVRDDWERRARGGQLDDAVMAQVDRLIGRVGGLAGLRSHDQRGAPAPPGLHRPVADADHDHDHDRTETFFGSQLRALDAHRGTRARPATGVGGMPGRVRQATALPAAGSAPALEEADRISVPRERLFAEVDRIFGHPYDSNWWVPLVLEWCRKHPKILERSVQDRNAGVMHSHSHGG